MKTCGDQPVNIEVTCTLKTKHRTPHTDGKLKWVYYCEECDAEILKPGMCKRCGGKELE